MAFSTDIGSNPLFSEICKSHWTYLLTEESLKKIEEKNKLIELVKLYFSNIIPTNKFYLSETIEVLEKSITQINDFSPIKAVFGFEAISQYANNLLAQSWRKEFKTIRMYCGFYQHEVEANLIDSDKLFEAMGYIKSSNNNQILLLEEPICPDRVANVSRDAIFALVECSIISDIYIGLLDLKINCTWNDIFKFRQTHSGTITDSIQTIAMLRQQRNRKENITENHTMQLSPPVNYNNYVHSQHQFTSNYDNLPHQLSACSMHFDPSQSNIQLQQNQQYHMKRNASDGVAQCLQYNDNNYLPNHYHQHQSKFPPSSSQHITAHSNSLDYDQNLMNINNNPTLNINPCRHSFDQPYDFDNNNIQYDCVDGYKTHNMLPRTLNNINSNNKNNKNDNNNNNNNNDNNNNNNNSYNVSGNRYPIPQNISNQFNAMPCNTNVPCLENIYSATTNSNQLQHYCCQYQHCNDGINRESINTCQLSTTEHLCHDHYNNKNNNSNNNSHSNYNISNKFSEHSQKTNLDNVGNYRKMNAMLPMPTTPLTTTNATNVATSSLRNHHQHQHYNHQSINNDEQLIDIDDKININNNQIYENNNVHEIKNNLKHEILILDTNDLLRHNVTINNTKINSMHNNCKLQQQKSDNITVSNKCYKHNNNDRISSDDIEKQRRYNSNADVLAKYDEMVESNDSNTSRASDFDSYEDTEHFKDKMLSSTNKINDGIGSYEQWDCHFQKLGKRGYEMGITNRDNLMVQGLNLDTQQSQNSNLDKRRMRNNNCNNNINYPNNDTNNNNEEQLKPTNNEVKVTSMVKNATSNATNSTHSPTIKINASMEIQNENIAQKIHKYENLTENLYKNSNNKDNIHTHTNSKIINGAKSINSANKIQRQSPVEKVKGRGTSSTYNADKLNNTSSLSSNNTFLTAWNCIHCTFLNPANIRICEICSKTRDIDTTISKTTTRKKYQQKFKKLL